MQFKEDFELKEKDREECDFFVDNFLFIECKAIRMKPLAQINPNPDRKKLLNPIIKAYEQIIDTANRLNTEKEKFGLILTYLPFYFTDGSDIWNLFIRKSIEKYLSKKSYELKVKPENLFFIDIESWDLLIAMVKSRSIDLYSIFRKAKENNQSPRNRKFRFSDHLNDFF